MNEGHKRTLALLRGQSCNQASWLECLFLIRIPDRTHLQQLIPSCWGNHSYCDFLCVPTNSLNWLLCVLLPRCCCYCRCWRSCSGLIAFPLKADWNYHSKWILKITADYKYFLKILFFTCVAVVYFFVMCPITQLIIWLVWVSPSTVHFSAPSNVYCISKQLQPFPKVRTSDFSSCHCHRSKSQRPRPPITLAFR